jgi:hypothetical protein
MNFKACVINDRVCELLSSDGRHEDKERTAYQLQVLAALLQSKDLDCYLSPLSCSPNLLKTVPTRKHLGCSSSEPNFFVDSGQASVKISHFPLGFTELNFSIK